MDKSVLIRINNRLQHNVNNTILRIPSLHSVLKLTYFDLLYGNAQKGPVVMVPYIRPYPDRLYIKYD